MIKGLLIKRKIPAIFDEAITRALIKLHSRAMFLKIESTIPRFEKTHTYFRKEGTKRILILSFNIENIQVQKWV